jgi:hypothetical protein
VYVHAANDKKKPVHDAFIERGNHAKGARAGYCMQLYIERKSVVAIMAQKTSLYSLADTKPSTERILFLPRDNAYTPGESVAIIPSVDDKNNIVD